MIRLPRQSLTRSNALLREAQVQAGLEDAAAADYANTRAASAAWLSMRTVLVRDQRDKCGWCESFLEQRATEIDHIRPKSRHRYWWLAFDLDNLLASCRSCNNYKGSHWPLSAGAQPLRPRQVPRLKRERALVVDPTVEDPGEHLTFIFVGKRWRIAGISPRGRATIRVLQLDRDSLTRKINYHVRSALDPLVGELHAALASGERGKYVSAGRRLAAFTQRGHPWSALNMKVYEEALAGNYQP